MAAPVQLAAIDAGSNAIRLVIARATSPKHIEILDNERASVRLGHNAFTRRVIGNDTIERATRAAVRCRVPVSLVGTVELGIRWTFALAIREASAETMIAPSIFASSDNR